MSSLARSLTPAVVLAALFAALYVGVGPGCFFSVDEVNVLETAQAALERGNLEIPAMPVSVRGVAGAYYSVKPPALAYVCLPLVALGNLLDDAFGSLKGGAAQGPSIGTEEHPLRWGGRLAIFTALVTNAVLGGASVALLFLIGRRLGASPRACLLMALISGLGTLLASESTHLFRHPLEALGLLLGFWFFSDKETTTVARRMLLGTTSLGIAFLAGPNTVASAGVLWLYGVVKAFNETEGAADTRSRLRLLARPVAFGLIPALVGLALYFAFNHLRFGDVAAFGYEKAFQVKIFQLSLREALLAVAAYLASPTLSVFLFAPPLLLALPALGQSLRRWPLETRALLWAAGAHLALVALSRFWHGAISYGPRYAIVSILLLMPLTLPGLEKIEKGASSGWRVAFAATLALGLLVQVLGLAVYVNIDRLRLAEGGYDAWSASAHSASRWVFVPSLSPPWVHLNELLAGRNVIPWALRAIKQPGLALVFWAFLAVVVGVGALWLWRFYERGEDTGKGTRLPERIVLALAFLIAVGYLFTGRVTEPLATRAFNYLNDGMAAHREGRHVMAQELYALVLGLEPQNKYALYNLGLLHETAGQADKAISLFRRTTALDPGFTVASVGLARLGGAAPDAPPRIPDTTAKVAPDEPESASRCHSRAQAFWDAGDKKAALGAWEECGQKFPDQSAFLRNVARCRYDLGDFDGAARDYRRLVAMLPNDLVAQTDLAWALLRAGRLGEARRLCEAVLNRDAGNASARAVLAQLEAAAKRKTK